MLRKFLLAGLVASALLLTFVHSQIAAAAFFLFLGALFLQIVFGSTEPDKWRPL